MSCRTGEDERGECSEYETRLGEYERRRPANRTLSYKVPYAMLMSAAADELPERSARHSTSCCERGTWEERTVRTKRRRAQEGRVSGGCAAARKTAHLLARNLHGKLGVLPGFEHNSLRETKIGTTKRRRVFGFEERPRGLKRSREHARERDARAP